MSLETPVLETDLGPQLKTLRQRRGLSMRQLAERARVAASYVSAVERGLLSPTIATLAKLLSALDTDLAEFFAAGSPVPEGHVFRWERMRTASDECHRYTFILPRREDIRVEMLQEMVLPGGTPEFEALSCDLAGYVVEGQLLLDVQDAGQEMLQPRDAFYIHAGRPARGICIGDTPVRLITVIVPPRYSAPEDDRPDAVRRCAAAC